MEKYVKPEIVIGLPKYYVNIYYMNNSFYLV